MADPTVEPVQAAQPAPSFDNLSPLEPPDSGPGGSGRRRALVVGGTIAGVVLLLAACVGLPLAHVLGVVPVTAEQVRRPS